jgi:hypothetical protein
MKFRKIQIALPYSAKPDVSDQLDTKIAIPIDVLPGTKTLYGSPF